MTIHRTLLIKMFLCVLMLGACAVKARAQGAVPRLISDDCLDQYLKYLTLSDAQAFEARRLYQVYLDDWSKSFDRDIAIANAKWAAAYTSPDKFVGDSMAGAFREAREAGDRLKNPLKSANDYYFDQVEGILSDDQVPLMQRARLAHDRLRYGRSKSGGFRERHIDLVDLLEQMPLSDVDRQRVAEVLVDFEPAFVDALRNAAEVDQKRAAMEFEIYDIDRRFASNHERDQASEMEMARLTEQAGKVGISAERRLVTAIRRGLSRFRDALSPSAAVDLQRRYDEEAYPEVYPDPALADSLYVTAENIKGLDEMQIVALQAMGDQYVTEHAKASKQMAKTFFDLSVIYYRGEPNAYVEQAVPKQKDISRLGEGRENLNLAQPARIRAILLPDQNEQLPAWNYEKQLPPRPWDPYYRPPPPPARPPSPQPATQPATQPK